MKLNLESLFSDIDAVVSERNAGSESERRGSRVDVDPKRSEESSIVPEVRAVLDEILNPVED